MRVRATVVDLRGDQPRSTDEVWVDTNVWLVLAYTRVPCERRLEPYAKYVKSLLGVRAKLAAGTVNIAELARCVEFKEREIFEAANGVRFSSIKEFRKSGGRVVAAQAIKDAWSVLTTLATLSPYAVQSAHVSAAADGMLSGDFLDGGDAVQLAEARQRGLALVLSDDSDFATVEGITLLTANERVLRLANEQQRLERTRG